ncbi:lysophospholipid acyltransferase family protein [Zoogloea sp. LCSB751]|uniref:lysophospholipid acyltransferase family protein n=1 Tax=Zoogloea sp. LCSB751 TaxID=1965277 RepID=UPI0009A4E38C|nr:lysophospholipid acyltransferase family protein [Zoogloea sp. LCSB751]
MTLRDDLPAWRHYFIDTPFWAAGLGGRRMEARMQHFHRADLAPTRHALQFLWGAAATDEALDAACRQALHCKIEREADAYRCQLPASPSYTIEGLPHLQAACQQKGPVFLLTGHLGSFYTIAVALQRVGIPVFPVARSVDDSPANPTPRRLFERFNYASTERRIGGHYLYTDFAGWMDKRIVSVCRQGGVVLVLPDLPRRLFPGGRHPVTLFDRPATLPARLFELGHKYKARFLPTWSLIGTTRRARSLRIEAPLPTESVAATLQGYADSLSRIVREAPAQWMALPIIEQYLETPDAP